MLSTAEVSWIGSFSVCMTSTVSLPVLLDGTALSVTRFCILESLIPSRILPSIPGLIHFSEFRQSSRFRLTPVPHSQSLAHSTIFFDPVFSIKVSMRCWFCSNFARMPGVHFSSATSSHVDRSYPLMFFACTLQSRDVVELKMLPKHAWSLKNSAFFACMYCSDDM